MKMANENIDMIGEIRISACKFKIIVLPSSCYTADRSDLQSCTHLCIWRALCSRGLC